MKRETENCTALGCWRAAIASLESRPLCRKHFIGCCEAELEAYQCGLKENRFRDMSPESAKRFVHECLKQADTIERGARDLDDLDRKRLIFHTADLRGHLRRSPRTVASISIQVGSEKPEQWWEERTETRLISRYVALVKCQRCLEIGENLRVVRLDNGRKAVARVAWQVRKKHGLGEIGLEFLNCDNFWELDWDRII